MRISPALLGALAAMGFAAGVPLPPPPWDRTEREAGPDEVAVESSRHSSRQSLRTSAPKTAACVRRSMPSLPRRLET